eukprot:scaffold7017_cov134-Cylindrotheca_fusiformis.AAC.3
MALLDCIVDPGPKHAFYLSITGCFLEALFTAAGVAGFFVSGSSMMTGSALLLLYGMENCVDFISSAVVLWRFYAPGVLTKEREKILHDREDRASVVISYLIILLGCLVIPAAVADLQAGEPEPDEAEDLALIVALSICSVCIFSFLTCLKLYYAKVLSSESLHKDGLCSVIGLLLSVLILINSWLTSSRPEYWKLDPYAAMCCGAVAIGIGSHGLFSAIYRKELNIFSLSFWRGGEEEAVPAEPENNDLKLSEVV